MTTIDELAKKHLPTLAPEDFFVLLSHATQKEKTFLFAHPTHQVSIDEEQLMKSWCERRRQHEPVAYIIGCREFYGRRFFVNSATLIPRPETEHLVECVITIVTKAQNNSSISPLDIIDIGTGSGNIIITLALELGTNDALHYTGIDISPQALTTAKNNAKELGAHTIHFFTGDLLQSYAFPIKKDRHLIITANLPYLSEILYTESAPTVKMYEPKDALVSGPDGLNHYRRLLGEIKQRISQYSTIQGVFEISPEQATMLTALITAQFPSSSISVLPDLSGRLRLIQAIFKT